MLSWLLSWLLAAGCCPLPAARCPLPARHLKDFYLAGYHLTEVQCTDGGLLVVPLRVGCAQVEVEAVCTQQPLPLNRLYR